MKNDHTTTHGYSTFHDDVALHRANADLARGEALKAGWQALVSWFRLAAARISGVNRISDRGQAAA